MQRNDLLIALACLAAAGCAKGGGNAATNAAAGQSGGTAVATASQPAGNACDRKLIATADIQPLLSETINNVKTLPGDAQSCVFTTTGFSSVTVTLRPGMGKGTIAAWRTGQMNSPVTPLPGVGDDAVWQPELKEAIASKNDVLCDVGAMGPASDKATPSTIGAICNKIYAGM